MPAASTPGYGQVIEYIPDHLYLASYTHTPTAQTPFPYPSHPDPAEGGCSPSKRSKAKTVSTRATSDLPPVYFSIDNVLLYNAFFADFGPLHIGHLYRFSVYLHNVLGEPAYENRRVVLWSKSDARSRANTACLLACYMILIQSWPPHLALAPIAQADPPLMPFRDAGYSQADYVIGVQDVVYGVWRAKEANLCGLSGFDLEEYEKFERADMGDLNWITPSFVAFASPQHQPVHVIEPSSPLYASLPKDLAELTSSKLPMRFKNVLEHFATNSVGLVVRLNSELYSPSYFTALGINHLDMIFDDGTCPPLRLVRQFINLAHDTIMNKKKAVAVHCKAGLGRTGCLIGPYIIYKYGFTANETIAYMRFMRPGMVVGPQQHWLHLNQGTFREWWWEDKMKEKLANQLPSTPTKSSHKQRLGSKGQSAMSPDGNLSKRSPLGEVDQNESPGHHHGIQDDALPAPTPGQPRKTTKIHERHHPYSRQASSKYEDVRIVDETSEMVSIHQESHVGGDDNGQGANVEQAEWDLQMVRQRISSRSPVSSKERRAISCTTTTSTTTSATMKMDLNHDLDADVENHVVNGASGVHRTKTPGSTRSGSGAGGLGVAKVRASPKKTGLDRAVSLAAIKEGSAGIRKASGRVGSVGTMLGAGGAAAGRKA